MIFTSQHVSINSLSCISLFGCLLYLHPNMYLLIPNKFPGVGLASKFTSQHVSINSWGVLQYYDTIEAFTSQHVSINSCADMRRGACFDFIYIPTCIY